MKVLKTLGIALLLMPVGAYTESFSPPIKELVNQSLQAEDSKEYTKAILIHEKILKLSPKNIYSINSIAGLYGKMGQYQNEILWAKKAIELDSNFELAYLNYGNGLFGLGNIKEAEDAFHKALQINPHSSEANYSLGVLADSQNHFELAIAFYKKALEANPKFEAALFNLGIDYANLKQSTKAILVFEQLLQVNPNDVDAQKMLIEMKKKQ